MSKGLAIIGLIIGLQNNVFKTKERKEEIENVVWELLTELTEERKTK